MSLICLLNTLVLFGHFLPKKFSFFYFIGMVQNFLLALALCTHKINVHSKRLNGPENNIYTCIGNEWEGNFM